MPAGFRYDLTPMDTLRETCRFDTVKRLSGGVNFEDASVPEGSLLMPLVPVHVDLNTRKATAVKNVKVAEQVTSGTTSVKVAKYSLAHVGLLLGNGTTVVKVTAVDKSNKDYDVLTIEAGEGGSPALAAEANDTLFEVSTASDTTPKIVANYLNYAVTKVEPGATITVIYRAYEVQESRLYTPLTEADKKSLGDNFTYIP